MTKIYTYQTPFTTISPLHRHPLQLRCISSLFSTKYFPVSSSKKLIKIYHFFPLKSGCYQIFIFQLSHILFPYFSKSCFLHRMRSQKIKLFLTIFFINTHKKANFKKKSLIFKQPIDTRTNVRYNT